MPNKVSNKSFIIKSQSIHQNKDGSPVYDYSETEYIKAKIPVKIICKLHGKFEQTPNNHLNGKGCLKCAIEKSRIKQKKSIDEFIEQAQFVHQNKDSLSIYDYSNVEYINTKTKVSIICKKHGIFKQTPKEHLKGLGCRLCYLDQANKNLLQTDEEFIKRAQLVHQDNDGSPIYDYSDVKYINARTKVSIKCKQHGTFEQSPDNHVKGHGCAKCARFINSVKRLKTTDEFIKESQLVHRDKDGSPIYDYSNVDYKGAEYKVNIKCNQHGIFEQSPNGHLQGHGCPACSSSKRYSAISIEWLSSLPQDDDINIRHALNGGEYKIPNSKYFADGFCSKTNTIYEFHGCYWHGCPVCYPNRSEFNLVNKKTFEECYSNTLKKKEFCKQQGFNYIEIWECEWRNKQIDI
jgi:hypothetical protein